VLPIVHGLEKEYGERIEFVRANILLPENEPLMEQYSFGTTPEFYLVSAEGAIIGVWDDSATADVLSQAFDEALEAQQQ
jgi:hypothetical protein